MNARMEPKPTTCRMFENEVLERFSRIHPATPFVAWLPTIAFLLYRSVHRRDLFAGSVVGVFVTGLVAWSLAEYVLHRYVFHWISGSAFGKRAHFILHGVHHDFPSDKDRLVMPLSISIPTAVVFYSLFFLVFGGARIADPFFAGFTLGYLVYDGTHYAIHHFKIQSGIGKYIRRHHMLHHHADHSGGFGVSTPLWDLVFDTMPSQEKAPSKQKMPAANTPADEKRVKSGA